MKNDTMPQAMKIPDEKDAVEKEWRQFQHGIWKKVKSKKEVILEAQRDKNESPLCFIDGHMPPQKMQS